MYLTIEDKEVDVKKNDEGYTITFMTKDGYVDDGNFETEEEAIESFRKLVKEYPNLVTK